MECTERSYLRKRTLLRSELPYNRLSSELRHTARDATALIRIAWRKKTFDVSPGNLRAPQLQLAFSRKIRNMPITVTYSPTSACRLLSAFDSPLEAFRGSQ